MRARVVLGIVVLAQVIGVPARWGEGDYLQAAINVVVACVALRLAVAAKGDVR